MLSQMVAPPGLSTVPAAQHAGNAPSFDPCGMAGGQWTPAIAGAEYRTTKHAKMGKLSQRLPLPSTAFHTALHCPSTACP